MTDKTESPMAMWSQAYSRRRLIAGSVVGWDSLASFSHAGVQEAPAEAEKKKTIVRAVAIHQEEDLPAEAHRVYEALLDAKQFRAFSGGRRAEIDRNPGGSFSLFAGHITGRNVDLLSNRRIVQAWRATAWPGGVYSIARFELQGHEATTRVIFDHTGFPSELAEHLEGGWRENYWKPLRNYLG